MPVVPRANWRVKTIVCDYQERFYFVDDFFDRIIAVHVMEYLPNLPAAIREAYRLLHKQRGQLLIVIPCEGGPENSCRKCS